MFDLRFEFGDGLYYISSAKVRNERMRFFCLFFIGVDKNLIFFALQLDWFSARNLCLSEDANLVSLETAEENKALTDKLSKPVLFVFEIGEFLDN
jgi:hypothetical protein